MIGGTGASGRIHPTRFPQPSSRRLSILQVVLSMSPGGTERLIVEMARRLAPVADTAVCCLDEDGAWAEELRAIDVPVVSLGRRPGFHPALGYRIAQVARVYDSRVLHCHHYSPFVYGSLAAILAPGRGLIFTEHGRLSDAGPSRKRRVANTFFGRLPHAIYAVSAELRRHLIAEGLPANLIRVIYNGVEPGTAATSEDRGRARELLGLTSGEFVIGTVARLDAVKSLETLVEACRRPALQDVPARLVIVGDGPERSRLEALASTLGIARPAVFLGRREDVRTLLPAFDVYVNSSISEGISLTILEAMAASLPVVATRVGGTPEVVSDGETGVLVPARDPERLARALRQLRENPASRLRMGQGGRARVLQQFSIDRMLQAYLEVYRKMALTLPPRPELSSPYDRWHERAWPGDGC